MRAVVGVLRLCLRRGRPRGRCDQARTDRAHSDDPDRSCNPHHSDDQCDHAADDEVCGEGRGGASRTHIAQEATAPHVIAVARRRNCLSADAPVVAQSWRTSEECVRLGENATQDLLDFVELCLAADERRRELDDRVAAVVGATIETGVEQRG